MALNGSSNPVNYSGITPHELPLLVATYELSGNPGGMTYDDLARTRDQIIHRGLGAPEFYAEYTGRIMRQLFPCKEDLMKHPLLVKYPNVMALLNGYVNVQS